MQQLIRIRLEPAGLQLELPPGASLQDRLFDFGVEFPCGGQGICKACRVRLLSGYTPPSPEDLDTFTQDQLEQGWRLACRLEPVQDLVLEIHQWQTPVLLDSAHVTSRPRAGLGVAVDVGTTTLAAQAVDLRTGRVVASATALNPQALYGADLMSRISYALGPEDGQRLTRTLREAVRSLVQALGPGPELRTILLVGNTAMHHFFCGLDVAPLARVPFETAQGGWRNFRSDELEWLPPHTVLSFLPCIGGFVGSDILAGILATGLHESPEPACLIDLGTNGEVVIGSRQSLVCASAAAGPAFEAANISMGMRATTGAIYRVLRHDGYVVARVIGGTRPRGICGSGLVDAAAVALDTGVLEPSGRLKVSPWTVADGVTLTQSDIRQLQLAKAAIAAAIELLLAHLGWRATDLRRVYLAGAFGNYIHIESARRIGLFPFPAQIVQPAGNTALRGAKIALFLETGQLDSLLCRTTHVRLAEQKAFQEAFVRNIPFPFSAG